MAHSPRSSTSNHPTDTPVNRSAGRDGFRWTDWTGVLFDLDGVVTPTARIHEQAWSELFAPWDATEQDYLAYIDGRPRYDGVATFLASRGVELPWGEPTDAPGDDTVCALGNKKNDLFRAILDRDGIEPYAGTMRVVDLLDERAIPKAIVSSSRNAGPVLAAAGIADRFGIVVDGITAASEGLPGKPDPAMFLRGAELIGQDPRTCVVVEDAGIGVAAGVAGEFGFVLGVDRGNNRANLAESGAHDVVDDLGDTLSHPATTYPTTARPTTAEIPTAEIPTAEPPTAEPPTAEPPTDGQPSRSTETE